MMTAARDALSKADAVTIATIATIEAAIPTLVTACTPFDRFQTMKRRLHLHRNCVRAIFGRRSTGVSWVLAA